MAAGSLKLEHYFSRPRTPKDNAFDERFNRTLQDEFIALGHLTDDCAIFNRELTEWLIEYNFHRPHQSLRYETPIQFHNQHYKVLPMYPASTIYCKKEILCYNTNSEHWSLTWKAPVAIFVLLYSGLHVRGLPGFDGGSLIIGSTSSCRALVKRAEQR